MSMILRLACALLFASTLTPAWAAPPKPAPQAPVKWVNPLGGTDSSHAFSRGNLYPAVAVPFGMNAWTPQTGLDPDGWTYRYDAQQIRGLKLTHQPSPWINDYGSLSLMPMSGELRVLDKDRGAYFSHERETARPYAYKVKLLESGIWAEVTPTSRAAVLRFTYPATPKAYVVLDAFPKGRKTVGEQAIGDVSVQVDAGRRRIVGISRYNHGGVPANFGHHFVVEFDQEIADCGTWDASGPKKETSLQGDHVGVWVEFKAAAGLTLQAKVGTSFIGPGQAELNLRREVGESDYAAVEAKALKAWEGALGRVKVEGGDAASLEVFYSCLYRTHLFPRTFSEVDASGKTVHYSPYNGQVEPGPLFTDNGFWDTFRAAFPLMALMQPSLDNQMMQGIVNAYKEGGWIPEWQSPGYRDCMIGTNSSSILADAWAKGIRGWDAHKAWEGMVKGAHAAEPSSTSLGRLGAAHYDRLGYVPSDVKIDESAARTLEYAYDDWCMWRFGKGLGLPAGEVEPYLRSSRNYRKLFDPGTGFMRGRMQDGAWQSPFRPDSWGGVFTEGCSWHWTWCVFHDPAGLSSLLGGDAAMAAKLDSVFTTRPTFESSYYGGVIHEIAEMVVADMGQYAHGNQPIQHMIYLYDWVGQPWKAQRWARETMARMYRPGPGMYCGDEDNGQTSAWYVFSALGFYPVTPGQTQYALGSPRFAKATLKLENGRTFTVEAPGNGPDKPYIQSATLNGKPLNRNWIDHAEIQAGGILRLVMSSQPNLKRGTRPEDRPYSLSRDPEASRAF